MHVGKIYKDVDTLINALNKKFSITYEIEDDIIKCVGNNGYSVLIDFSYLDNGTIQIVCIELFKGSNSIKKVKSIKELQNYYF